jgi:hypothetical protein
LTATLNADNSNSVFSATIAEGSFKNTIIQNNSSKGFLLDQPWIRTGTPSAANPDPIYVGYNDFNNGDGKTASVLVNNGGGISSIVTIDRMGVAAGPDAPSVRLAVNGDTVYSAFIRRDTVVESGANGNRYGSEVVVVRSDNGGADGFLALGPIGDGVTVAAPTSPFTGKPSPSNPLSVGAERIGSDLAIAVDPKNKDHVVVAYVDAPGPDGSNLMKVVVKGSTDGGNTWDRKFETTSSIMTRQALPSLAILDNGVIALLYLQYEFDFNSLSTHLLATADDFVTTRETIIAEASNAFPVPDPNIFPYVGDFFDMTSIGSIIYGVFSASNADTCGEFLIGPACFPNDVTIQRAHDGTPGTEDFTLCNPTTGCIPVGFSIDPFFFTVNLEDLKFPCGADCLTPLLLVPEPGGLFVLGAALACFAVARCRLNKTAFYREQKQTPIT